MCILYAEQRSYPSDVTDAQWAILEPLIPAAKTGGRSQEIARREIVNGFFSVLRKKGCIFYRVRLSIASCVLSRATFLKEPSQRWPKPHHNQCQEESANGERKEKRGFERIVEEKYSI